MLETTLFDLLKAARYPHIARFKVVLYAIHVLVIRICVDLPPLQTKVESNYHNLVSIITQYFCSVPHTLRQIVLAFRPESNIGSEFRVLF